MMLVEADSKMGKVVSKFDMPSKDRYDCLTHPVICGGRLYLRQGNILYAYSVRASSPK
jgi:hypothetical protein